MPCVVNLPCVVNMPCVVNSLLQYYILFMQIGYLRPRYRTDNGSTAFLNVFIFCYYFMHTKFCIFVNDVFVFSYLSIHSLQ